MVMLFALALQSTVAPKTSSAFNDKQVGPWIIKVGDAGCSAIDSFEEKSNGLKSALILIYDIGSDSMKVGFSNQKFNAIETGKKYTIKVEFIKGKIVDTGWGDTEFIGVHTENIGGGLLVRGFNSVDMLKDLTNSSAIGFEKDGKVIAAFPLQQMSSLLPLLANCAKEYESEHPTDPFAK